MIDPVCKTPTLDSTLISAFTANFSVTDFTPFLCEILRLATKSDVDPVLYEPKEYNYEADVLNFAALTAVGDPRVSLGYVLSVAYNEFFPRAVAELEFKRTGGCQVIEGYICDADGRKLKQATTYCPPNYQVTSYLSTAEIISKTVEIVKASVHKHAEGFANYIKSLRENGWVDTLHVYKNFPIFYVKLTKNSEKDALYYKYYFDTREIVANLLDKSIYVRTDNAFDNQNHLDAVIYMSVIPDY